MTASLLLHNGLRGSGRSKREIEVSLPPRRYDLVGALLADAVTRAEDGAPIATAVAEVARESGVRVGQGATRPASSTGRACLVDLLVKHGDEPQERQGDIALVNWPFHKLAENHRQLVCGMNLGVLAGILDGLGADGLNARLVHEPVAAASASVRRNWSGPPIEALRQSVGFGADHHRS